jgi:hypothetical protein
LSFISAPNFESPADANHDNVYDLVLSVTDNVNFVTTAVQVTVVDVPEGLTFDSTAFSTPENTTTVGTVHASGGSFPTSTYSIVGGADAARFTITSSGTLRFATAQNYEAPTDVGGDRVYEVLVRAVNGSLSVLDTIRVTLTDQNESPAFSGSTAFSVAENTTAITTVLATDPESQALSYSINGGADAAFFQINPTTGALSFAVARDYEVRADAVPTTSMT